MLISALLSSCLISAGGRRTKAHWGSAFVASVAVIFVEICVAGAAEGTVIHVQSIGGLDELNEHDDSNRPKEKRHTVSISYRLDQEPTPYTDVATDQPSEPDGHSTRARNLVTLVGPRNYYDTVGDLSDNYSLLADLMASTKVREMNSKNGSSAQSGNTIRLTWTLSGRNHVLVTCSSTLSEDAPPSKEGIDQLRLVLNILEFCLIVEQNVAAQNTKIKSSGEKNNSNNTTGEGSAENLSSVVFWGAQTYMSTNIAHVVLCVLVVGTYLSVPGLGKSAYERAIVWHNICLLALGCILTILAYCDLRDCPVLNQDCTIALWLTLQYFTNATVLWLNVICFDVTLAITRFRWVPLGGLADKKTERKKQNRRRSLVYSTFAWGCAILPTGLAAFFEYSHLVPQDFPLKPNYLRYRMGPNPIVNLYFFVLPLFTLFWNNVLFAFTTYKILQIQKNIEMATGSSQNNILLRKKYLLFLKLYLLMGAPWFFGSLFACLNKLVILKICRMIQPLLWLLMLFTRKKFRRNVASKLHRLRTQFSTNGPKSKPEPDPDRDPEPNREPEPESVPKTNLPDVQKLMC